MIKTIDMTPTWKQVLPMMIMCIENPDLMPESRIDLRLEFDRMAEAADKFNALQQANQAAVDVVAGGDL